MSGVGGIGGIGGVGSLGVNINIGGLSTGGLNGPVGDINAATLSALSGTRMDQLLELMDGFSSAEILIALMLAGMSGRRRHQDDDAGAAMGFLFGLALASQLGQGVPPLPCTGVSAPDAMTGGQINLTA